MKSVLINIAFIAVLFDTAVRADQSEVFNYELNATSGYSDDVLRHGAARGA